jgi:hypothetical protein
MTARPGPDGQIARATGHTIVIVVAAAQSLRRPRAIRLVRRLGRYPDSAGVRLARGA